MYRKEIARLIGRKLPYFKGKYRLVNFLYPSNKFNNRSMGDKFIIDYHGKKYAGITSNFIDWGVYIYNGLENGLINYLKTEIDNFNYYIDIGSNSGTSSLPFTGRNNLKIICFEPLDYSYKKLIKNFALNDALNETDFHKIALSDKSGQSFIYYPESDENIGATSLDANWDGGFKNKNKKSEKIQTERLDSLYNFKNENLFIKIDVEGHEKYVLDGSINILKNNKVLMYLETTNNEILNQLKDLNFKIYFPYFRDGKFKFTSKQSGADVILKNF